MRSTPFVTCAALSLLIGCANDIYDPPLPGSPVTMVGGSGQVYVEGGTGWVPAGGHAAGPPRGSQAGSGEGAQGGAGQVAQGGGSIVTGGNTATMPGSASPMDLQGAPIFTRFMRLTHEQWERAVQDVLKLAAPPGLAASFEDSVAGTTDFVNNEHVLSVTNTLWDQYREGAEKVAAQATASEEALKRVYSGTDVAGFVNAVGRRAYRRPLTSAEVQKYQALHTTGSTLSGDGTPFAKGAALVIRTLLQSPNFLYRTELAAKGSALTGYEVASKLAFLLRGTTPTDADLDAAQSGALDAPEGAAMLASQMLSEPAAAEVFKRFHAEMLHFSQFGTINKMNVPEYTPALNADYQQSATLFFDRIFQKNLGVRDILTSTIGFVNPALAKLYGVQTSASGFAEVDLGPERPGYFSQLPYLTLHGLNDEPDSILRGRDINLGMLCATLGMPAVIPGIPALKPGQTNRERITDLTGGCGGECHTSLLNPAGFAFENFDGMGRLRTMDNGKPVDTSGRYPFAEGVKSFSGAAEFMKAMADGVQAHACYAKKLSSYALQRDIVASDVPLLETLKTASMAGSVKQVVLELVKNPAFRTRVQ
jgi:hypothetical protein